MTNEQLEKGESLKAKIEDTERRLEMARKRITVHGVYDGGQTTSLRLKGEVIAIIQTITIEHLEKELADTIAEYEAL